MTKTKVSQPAIQLGGPGSREVATSLSQRPASWLGGATGTGKTRSAAAIWADRAGAGDEPSGGGQSACEHPIVGRDQSTGAYVDLADRPSRDISDALTTLRRAHAGYLMLALGLASTRGRQKIAMPPGWLAQG